MKKLSIDGIGYYLSCMMLFNLVFSIKMVIDGLFQPSFMIWKSWKYWTDFITFCISALLFLLGCFFTAAIVKRDDSIQAQSTIGRRVIISELEDLTSENYFTNYSLLVLTGLSLPTSHNILSLALYIIIFVTLGLVYIKRDLIYMNPVLTILNFNIYRCCDVDDKQQYVFVVRDVKLENGDHVFYQDVSKKIIRINRKEAIEKQSIK